MTALETARRRLAAARGAVITAERNLDDAIKHRDRAEEALYRAEEEDNGSEQ